MSAPTGEENTMEKTACVVCGSALCFRWTDTHGVGACTKCGAPYRIYHYENDKRVERPPECLLLPEWVPPLTKYHAETGRNCDPGAFNLPGSSYEVATQEDVDALDAWLKAHPDEVPVLP